MKHNALCIYTDLLKTDTYLVEREKPFFLCLIQGTKVQCSMLDVTPMPIALFLTVCCMYVAVGRGWLSLN